MGLRHNKIEGLTKKYVLLHVGTLLHHLRAHLWEEPDLSSGRKGEVTVSNFRMTG